MVLKEIKIENAFGSYTNCYIVADEVKKEAIVIDPAGECDKIIEMLNILNVNLKYIYATHCHADHIGGIEELKTKTGSTFLIHRIENENLQNSDINLSSMIGMKNFNIQVDSRVDEGDIIHVGDLVFKVIHTPGHTNGGTSLYSKQHNLLFSGDTLFKNVYGRYDLPTRK